MRKLTTIIVVFLIVGILIGGGIYAFFYYGKAGGVEDTEATSEDGSASLSATFYSSEGAVTGGGVLQALIGGTARRTHVSFALRGTNTGDVVLLNVKPSTPNPSMDGAFDNVIPLPSLSVGASNVLVGSTNQSCTATAQCNTNEQCCQVSGSQIVACGSVTGMCLIALDPYASGHSGISNPVSFSVSLAGNYTTPQGSQLTITSSAVTLTYDIRGEACTDGTLIQTCVSGSPPNYCRFIEGSAPSIIPNATFCGCPVGQHASGDICVPDTCADGTIAGQFSTASGTYTVIAPSGSASRVMVSGYVTALNNTRVYCKTDLNLEVECNNARITLGGGVLTNEFACKKDALDRYAIACNPTGSTEPSTCIYASVSPGLSGTIGEG